MKNNHIAQGLVKLGVVLLLIYLSNGAYTKYFWPDDLHKYEGHVLLDLREIEDGSDIIYLGESSNFSTHPEDTQHFSISQLIDRQIPEKVGTLNKGAYHAGLFLELIRQIQSPNVHTVIVTLNLRTLNQATIHSPIETALQKQNRLFKQNPPLFNRLLLTLNAYDNKTLAERDKLMWREWTYDTLVSNQVAFPAPTIKSWCEMPKFVDETGREDMEKRTLADHYVKAYAFQIDTNTNPRIKQLDEIVELCGERGYRLVFNFLAENTEYADSLAGPSLVWLMRQNRDLLQERYRQKGAVFVDNLEAVKGQWYTDQHWTTEHYNQYGRQLIADRVVQAMRSSIE